MGRQTQSSHENAAYQTRLTIFLSALILLTPSLLWSQTDCDAGNGPLDSAQPKNLSPQQVIEKLGAAESRAKDARLHSTYKQDVLMQTLNGKNVTGEFHEVTTVSYDARGKRQEEVTYAAQSTLRGIQLTPADMDDVRTFMPLILASDDLAQYNLNYDGQQHVDDLDTYLFHVSPRKLDKDHRYFEGRIWVDAQDFQIVKVCGKSGPEKVNVKKRERPQLQPTFVTYRQQVDGNWLPAYTRSDDTLPFGTNPAHLHEIIKYTGYQKMTGAVSQK
jgi:YD repeat-containing protein